MGPIMESVLERPITRSLGADTEELGLGADTEELEPLGADGPLEEDTEELGLGADTEELGPLEEDNELALDEELGPFRPLADEDGLGEGPIWEGEGLGTGEGDGEPQLEGGSTPSNTKSSFVRGDANKTCCNPYA
jgi:hypothetical protein